MVDIQKANSFSIRLNKVLDALEKPSLNQGRIKVLQAMYNEYSGEELSGEAVRKWLKGNGYPDSGRILKLAAALGVTTDYLLDGRGDMFNRSGVTNALGVNEEISKYSHNPKPIDLDKAGIPAKTILRLFSIVEKGIGLDRFNDYPEEERERIIRVLQKALLDSDFSGMNDQTILKMVSMK